MSTYAKKKWKIAREKIISESDGKCAWCGSTDHLTVHHTNPPKIGLQPYLETAYAFMQEYFKDNSHKEEYERLLKKSQEYAEEKTVRKTITRCPKCGYATLYERQSIKPKYRCTKCKYEGEEKATQETLWAPMVSRSMSFYFQQEHEEEIKKRYAEYKLKAKKDYGDLENSDIILICKRCHFAYHNGMVLCKTCKKTYHKRQYSSCYNCKTYNPVHKRRVMKE